MKAKIKRANEPGFT